MVEPGEDWFEYPDGVPELTNDGIDCCPRCQAVENGSGRTFGPYPFSIHGHAPVSWEPKGERAIAFYHCDFCGHRWSCRWSFREDS